VLHSLRELILDFAARLLARALPSRIMLAKRTFLLWERRGYHVTPLSFYEPIPDTRTLKDSLWTDNTELVGVDLNEAGQRELLAELRKRYKPEWDELPLEAPGRLPHEYFVNNRYLESVDGEMLYAMIRHCRPRRIIEVGSGYSTYLAAQAIRMNTAEESSYTCDLTAVEPFPNPVLRRGFPGLTRLIQAPVQDVPLTEFSQLRANDILFIDSSHVLKIGSDVHYEILSILPRLAPSVLVHIHDIFLPAEYPKNWVLDEHRFWNEQYLLHAFLCFSQRFRVVWAGSFMHMKHPELLEAAFRSYHRASRWPGSFWMRRV